MWRTVPPEAGDIQRLLAARLRLDLNPLAIHTNYLINLATEDPEIRAKSVLSFRGELERAVLIGADYLVLHPGNYKGQTLEQGMVAFASGLAEAAQAVPGCAVTVLLENTVGCGSQIGSRFEELRTIRDLAAVRTDLRIAYCLDTCHLLAGGFDVASEAGLEKTVDAVDRILGLELVRLIHANDSKGALCSRLDRHENIGKGNIGEQGFRRILRHPGLRDKPFVLETPADDDTAARADIDALKRLAGKRRRR